MEFLINVIALAVRTNSPIYIAEEVIRQAGKERPAFEEELSQQAPGEDASSILTEWEERLKQRQERAGRETEEE